jgi:hypothetical protein
MEEVISAKRPKLSLNSVKTYASNLRSLCRDICYYGAIENLLEFHTEKVTNYILTLDSNRRKQASSALLIFFPDNTELKTIILDANKACAEHDEKQDLTEAQKLAWLSWDSILETRSNLYQQCIPLWVKLNLNKDEYDCIQNYVLSMVMTCIPPRRCLDYCYMKISDDNIEDSDNFITVENGKATFVFNRYKTSKCYGQQSVEIPIALWEVIREWKKINLSCWLFHVSQTNLSPLRSDQFSRKLGKVFNKPGFGVNLLRHAFVSDEFLSNMPFITELKETAYKLGHSMKETLLYKKHNN